MKYNYEVEVKFHGDCASPHQASRYNQVVMMYDGEEISKNKQEETTLVSLHPRKELTLEGLARLLGENIPIISFSKME